MSWTDVRRWGTGHPDVVDAVVAVALLVVGLLSVQATQQIVLQTGVGSSRVTPLGWAAFVVLVGALGVRRRFPLTVVVVASAAFMLFQAQHGVEGTVSSVALFVAIHAAGAYGRARARTVVRALMVAALMATLVWSVVGDTSPGSSALLLQSFAIGLNVFFFGAAWVFGDLSRTRMERERQLAERTAELEVARERNAARAIVEERVRIARELHDVLAHHVSVMGVQAGAARHVLGRSPERAAAPLAAIESSARSAVLELQRMLAFLRSDDDATEGGDRSPPPGLAQLDRLVADVRQAGIAVDLRVVGAVDDLPDTLHLSAYRIVQESLTNVIKHAGPDAHATVRVDREDAGLVVEVLDDGRGAVGVASPPGTGSGLVGMRERVALHGGRLEAGPRGDRGWRVRAFLPVGDGAARPREAPAATGGVGV